MYPQFIKSNDGPSTVICPSCQQLAKLLVILPDEKRQGCAMGDKGGRAEKNTKPRSFNSHELTKRQPFYRTNFCPGARP
jgi:hypothetical protein